MSLVATLCLVPLLHPVQREDEPLILTTRAVRADLSRVVDIPATVLPDQRAPLVPHVSGFVASVLVREGDRIGACDLLATIDVPLMSADVALAVAAVRVAEASLGEALATARSARAKIEVEQAAVDRARAELELRRVQLARVRLLREENAATDADLEEAGGAHTIATAAVAEAEAEVLAAEAAAEAADALAKSAEARLSLARLELDRLRALAAFAEIRCPYSTAIVLSRHVDPGVLVQADTTPVVTVASVGRLRVRLAVDERDALSIAPGSAVSLRASTGGAPLAETAVTRTFGALDPSTRTMGIEIDVESTGSTLRPGMLVYAALTVFERPAALSVPARALAFEGGESIVFVVRGGVLERVPVRTGVDDGIHIEIVEGVAEGEEIAVAGAAESLVGRHVRTREEEVRR